MIWRPVLEEDIALMLPRLRFPWRADVDWVRLWRPIPVRCVRFWSCFLHVCQGPNFEGQNVLKQNDYYYSQTKAFDDFSRTVSVTQALPSVHIHLTFVWNENFRSKLPLGIVPATGLSVGWSVLLLCLLSWLYLRLQKLPKKVKNVDEGCERPFFETILWQSQL